MLPYSKIYLNAFPKENRIVSYGIEFKEFIITLKEPVRNILVLAGGFAESEYNYATGFEYINGKNIQSILNADVKIFGDFCWVDFDDIELLKKLEPREVADLLYLGRFMKPVTSPFFERLNNRFTYLAHDDGWFNIFYYRNLKDINEVIRNIVPLKVMAKCSSIMVPELSSELSCKLWNLALNGLLIDFDHISKNEEAIKIPLVLIGKFLDMDEMYNNLHKHVEKVSSAGSLELKKNKWTISFTTKLRALKED